MEDWDYTNPNAMPPALKGFEDWFAASKEARDRGSWLEDSLAFDDDVKRDFGLETRNRIIVKLALTGKLKAREIAEATDCTEAAVKNVLIDRRISLRKARQ